MALEVKKIYVDSRYRTDDSKSDSDFRIQLGRNLFLPDKCIYHIENCVIPHSWYNIEEGLNDTMYLSVGIIPLAKITIPSANYTGGQLATTLTSLLSGFNLTASYDLNMNKITISCPASVSSFKIFTDSEMLTQWTAVYNSCNEIITNRTPKLNSSSSPWVSGMLNLQGFRSLYISSSTLSQYDTLGPKGEGNIIKKVITNADFGYLIIDQIVSDHDYLSCGRMTLNTIDFQIRDVRGNLIPFHDSSVSFTLVFTIKEN